MYRDDLLVREAREEWAAAINEPWGAYAARTGKSVRQMRVKEAGEMWEQFERRKWHQSQFIPDKRAALAADEEEAKCAHETREARSMQVVNGLVAMDKAAAERRTASRHCLHVDFDAFQRDQFASDRVFLAGEEELLRSAIASWQHTFTDALRLTSGVQMSLATQAEGERLAHEAALRAEVEAERQRQILAGQQREKEEKLAAEVAARHNKERLEVEKREDRKRREDEKRLKARADREKLRAQQTDDAEA